MRSRRKQLQGVRWPLSFGWVTFGITVARAAVGTVADTDTAAAAAAEVDVAEVDADDDVALEKALVVDMACAMEEFVVERQAGTGIQYP